MDLTVMEGIGTVAAAATSIYAAWRWGWPLLQGLGAFFVRGYRRIAAAFNNIESMPDRLTGIDGRLDGMEAAHRAAAEAATARGHQLDSHGQQLGAMSQQVALMGLSFKATADYIPNLARFEFSPDGLMVEASKPFLRWAGRQFSEVAGWGWITTVHPDDRMRVRNELSEAVRDCRATTIRYRMLGPGNEHDGFDVEFSATPIPEGGLLPCQKFVGGIYRLDD
jgi:PAS domain-containing protein